MAAAGLSSKRLLDIELKVTKELAKIYARKIAILRQCATMATSEWKVIESLRRQRSATGNMWPKPK